MKIKRIQGVFSIKNIIKKTYYIYSVWKPFAFAYVLNWKYEYIPSDVKKKIIKEIRKRER